MNISYINQSTNNISRILRIMELSEQNIQNIIGQQNTTLSSLENHLNNLMSHNNDHLIKYILENKNLFNICKYEELIEPINNVCPITQQTFKPNDLIIKINSCGHVFLKEDFTLWMNQSSLCPCCRVKFLIS